MQVEQKNLMGLEYQCELYSWLVQIVSQPACFSDEMILILLFFYSNTNYVHTR
jgi:hypothetical protein